MIRTDTSYRKTTSVAFTGHRAIPSERQGRLRERLKEAVTLSYRLGMRHFYCGMALGFDMMAAEVVLSLKGSLTGIRLTAVIPFKGQSDRWRYGEQERYSHILGMADEVVCLSDRYFDGCLLRRNDYLLSHSNGVIAYFDGKPRGGTFYTCREARRQGLDVINLYE